MIDKDTLRVARRTVERNGYTVLPPRESDERDLDRFRSRRELARQANDDEEEDYRPARPTTRQPRYEEEEYEERPTRQTRTTNYEDDGLEDKYAGQLKAYVYALKQIKGIDADARIYHIDIKE